MGTSTADKVQISATTNTSTTGVFDLDITTATSNSRGIDLAYTFSSTTVSAVGYGLYGLFTHSNASLTTSNTLYGQYLTFSDTTDLANTNYGIYATLPLTGNAAKNTVGIYGNVSSNSTTADSLYGGYFKTSATGNVARTTNYGAITYGQTTSTTADTVYGLYGIAIQSGAATTGTKSLIGLYGSATESAGNGSSSNTYGGLFNAVATTSGTGTTYGIYATASGGDTNWSGFFGSGTRVGIGTLPGVASTTEEGIRLNAANTIPSGLITESVTTAGEVVSLAINVPQIGTRDTTRVGGIFRLDTRSTEQKFVVFGYATGGSTPDERFSINLQSGGVFADLIGTGTGNAVCHSGAAGDTADVNIVDCTSAPSADYAEMYATDGDVTYGHLVSVGEKTVKIKALNGQGNVLGNEYTLE